MLCECIRVTRRIRSHLHPLTFLALATLVVLGISACGVSSKSAQNIKLTTRPQGTVYYYATYTPVGLPGQPTAPTNAIFARDASTGAQIWSDTVAADGVSLIASSSAVYASVFTGAADHSFQGSLQALRADNGKLLWQISPSSAVIVPQALSSSALFVRKGSYDASGTPIWDTILALNPTNGSQLWSVPLTSGSVEGVTLDGGTLYIAAATASPPPNGSHIDPINLLALDAATGKILWQVAVQNAAVGDNLVVSNGILYLTEQPGGAFAGTSATDTIEAFKTSDGTSLWKHDLNAVGSAEGATNTEVVAFAHQGTDLASLALVALAAIDGKQLWSIPLPNMFPASAPLASNGNLYVPILYNQTGAGMVENRGAVDGKQIWSHAIAEGAPVQMRLLGSGLYFDTLPGASATPGPPQTMLEALNSADGSLLWSIQLGVVTVFSLVVAPAA